MSITVAVMAQGSMGAGVGKRLNERGATVRTLLSGRSEASAGRAKAAGMHAVGDERELLAGADYFLSILPPDQAEGLASRLAPALQSLPVKPVYVDCNAVSPQTAQRIAAIVEPTGAAFADGGIIGGPPRDGYSPAIYASGPQAARTAAIKDYGIDWRLIDGPVGAASGLKMSYAGITKGTTAIAAAMLLGAARFGCAEALIAELESSQPEMLGRMKKSIPGMYDKAYRWVGEMQEISDFLDANAPSAEMYRGIAGLYRYLAAAEAEDAKADANAIKALDRVLGR
ncbi:MAG: NAD(P)-dependent oxidoreductase [Alphaproteobacteria bacterium]|nr:NAD(P)-dependent oxidoreductase [Alphaproteobacteria bacterium]